MLLQIQSKSHPYAVHQHDTFSGAVDAARATDATWLVDNNVWKLQQAAFEGIEGRKLVLVPASEEAKSYDAAGRYFLQVIESGFRRSSTLNVVGGGVLQDIGCFIASVLMRGVRWNLIPTTLLAQCDSCIGSKSSINIGPYKNQLGTFYSPHQVLLCPQVLSSLPEDDIRSGLGEAIKLHLVAGGEKVSSIRAMLASKSRGEDVLPQIISSSLRIKQRFIEADEFDHGVRRQLNYGHTFAHAYESATHYQIPHGIAVTLGVLSATYFSFREGLVPREHVDEIKQMVRPYYTPYEKLLASADPADILAAMKLDKKNTSQGVTFVLTRGPGQMELISLDMETQVRPRLADLLDELTVPIAA